MRNEPVMFNPAAIRSVFALAAWLIFQGDSLYHRVSFESGLLPSTQSTIKSTTNTYHLSFSLSIPENATDYGTCWTSNGVPAGVFHRIVTQRITNATFIVSNLTGNLDALNFYPIVNNGALTWTGSIPAVKHLVIITDGTNLISFDPTNVVCWLTNLHPVAIGRWDAASLLKRD